MAYAQLQEQRTRYFDCNKREGHSRVVTSYQDSVFKTLQPLFDDLEPVSRCLDFGSGSGWYARQFLDKGLAA